MNSESLNKFALIAEIIGGIAVVLSLIFVGLEVRQGSEETARSTRIAEMEAYQDLVDRLYELNNLIITDEGFADAYARIRRCEDYASEAEMYRMTRFGFSVIRHGDVAFHQYEQGIIDIERMEQMIGMVLNHLGTYYPAQQAWWGRTKSGINIPAFQKYVDERIRLSFDDIVRCPQTPEDYYLNYWE